MTRKKIAIIIGHPDPAGERFGRALAGAYASGASGAGHDVKVIDVAMLHFSLLRSQQEWLSTPVPDGLQGAADTLMWADHLVLIYPLWLGDVPAYFKAFLEQVLRPGKTVSLTAKPFDRKPFSGKSARVVVTMGMPAWVYRWVFGAHSLKSLKRNVLWFVGVSPVRHTIIGTIEAGDPSWRKGWLARMQALGRDAI